MTIFFLDTSALAKRYVPEIGSSWIRSLTTDMSENAIVISRLSTVEFVSALVRRQREKMINQDDFITLRGAFLNHVEKVYTIINLNKDVLIAARFLLERHSLRTLDAIQLASALKARQIFEAEPIFVSADTRLLTAAAAEGLLTDNPTAHS